MKNEVEEAVEGWQRCDLHLVTLNHTELDKRKEAWKIYFVFVW